MTLALTIIAWFLSVVSALGNAAVIFLIARRPSLRLTAGGIFVFSLAVADFCSGITYFPLSFICEKLDRCNIYAEATLPALFSYASRFNLFALTVDRYFSIAFPLKYTICATQKRIYSSVVASWITAIVVVSLDLVIMILTINGTIDNASPSFLTWYIVHIVIINITLTLILVFITIRLMFVVRRLRRQTSAIIAQLSFNKMSCNVTVNRRNREFDYFKIVGVLVGIYFLFFVMDTLANIFIMADIYVSAVDMMNIAVLILHLINSAANPFVYAFLKKDIRNELKRFFIHRPTAVAAEVS